MLVTYMKRLIDQPSLGPRASRVEVMGIALANNPVTVTSQGAYRKGEYFRKELSVNNAAAPVWQQVDVTAPNETTVTRHELVPQTPETFTYDADGNLPSDSLWANVWNAENRLVLSESAAGVPSAARMRETWTYLPDGRWIERIVPTNNGSTDYPAGTNCYVWDGNVLLAVLDHTNGLVMSFVRGLDLSGTIQGAGGVGGVLAVTFRTNGTHLVGYDGNGNVAALTDASTGANSAVFEYGPFGEPLRVTGPAAAAMPLRFSTMYEDDVTGDRKYRFREYRPSLGYWLNRDPIGELGGENLYGFAEDDPVDFVDFNGLTTVKKHAWSITQQQAMSGIWGWTDLESQEEKPAKLKMKKNLCLCVVTEKPEMVFTISVQTARSGKQSWKESAVFDGVAYPETSVYVGSGLASFSKQHEEKRFQAWKKALTGFWPGHYEDPAAKLTAPTCDQLKAKINALRQQAATGWETSAEGRELIRRLIEIGQQGASVSRWVRKFGFGSVRVVYDTN